MKKNSKLNRNLISTLIVSILIVLVVNVYGQPGGGPVPASITTGQVIPLSYCAGDSIYVPYSDSGTIGTSNIFTAELSDPYGDFSSPVIIGSLTTQVAGVIPCMVPWSAINGTGYRIRVVGSEPYIIGSDNTEDIEIKSKPVVSFTGSFPDQCENLTTLDIMDYAVVSPAGGQFSGPGVTGTNFSAFDAGSSGSPLTITYTYSDGIGCANTATNQIEVLAFPPVTITNLDTFYCTNFHSVTLIGSPVGGTFSGPGLLGGNIFNPATAGTGNHLITYSYTASNGCSDIYSQNVEVEKCTGINENNNEENNNEEINVINIFPNPSNGIFNIISNLEGVNDINIFSSQGALIKTLQLQQGEKRLIDLSFVSSGAYFIKTNEKIFTIEINK